MANNTTLPSTTTSPNIVGWVASSNDRGSIDLLWSCCLTILLCCWVSTRPNVPSPNDKWCHRFIDKANLVCIGVLGPDFLFAIAVGQLSSARRAVQVNFTSYSSDKAKPTDRAVEHPNTDNNTTVSALPVKAEAPPGKRMDPDPCLLRRHGRLRSPEPRLPKRLSHQHRTALLPDKRRAPRLSRPHQKGHKGPRFGGCLVKVSSQPDGCGWTRCLQ